MTDISPTAVLGAPSRSRGLSDRTISWLLTLVAVVPILLFLVMPLVAILARSFDAPAGFGFGNFTAVFGTESRQEAVSPSLQASAVRHHLDAPAAAGRLLHRLEPLGLHANSPITILRI